MPLCKDIPREQMISENEVLNKISGLSPEAQEWIRQKALDVLNDKALCGLYGLSYLSPEHEDYVKALDCAYESHLRLKRENALPENLGS